MCLLKRVWLWEKAALCCRSALSGSWTRKVFYKQIIEVNLSKLTFAFCLVPIRQI